MVKRIEALAEAIAAFSGYQNPDGNAYLLRNPGALRIQKGKRLGQLRRFDTIVSGFEALLYDLEVKCSGLSRSGLKATSPLSELLFALGFREETVPFVASKVRRFLGANNVNADTPIHYFMEDNDNGIS